MNEMQAETQEDTEKVGKIWHDIFEFLELFAIAACVILVLFTLICRLSVVSGGSMEHTLENGDKLIISDLFYQAKAGDIVVLQSPDVDGGIAIVKRIIATGGQTVQIKPDGVYVDGEKLQEEDGSLGYTVNFSPYTEYTYDSDHCKTIHVPEGEVFVMGDHRSTSLDSRSFGTVDERCIIGKVLFRVAPLSVFGTVN